jgi:hypothetical protein
MKREKDAKELAKARVAKRQLSEKSGKFTKGGGSAVDYAVRSNSTSGSQGHSDQYIQGPFED